LCFAGRYVIILYIQLAKFNELNINLSDMIHFEYKGNIYTFTEKLLKEYEVICVKTLCYNLDNSTAYDFIKLFLGVGVIFNNDCIQKRMEGSDEEIKMSLNSASIAKLKSVVSTTFYTDSLIDKIYALTINVLDIVVEGIYVNYVYRCKVCWVFSITLGMFVYYNR